jgi:catechol 2,3-dioxygenase-like lactoylglutathione lyase family enzyme
VVANVEVGNADFAAVRRLVARTHPDVFGVTELTPTMARQLGPALRGYRARVVETRNDAYGIAVYSRRPLLSAQSPIPGVLGVDHFGVTVPDVAQARDWFVDVLGCVAPLQFGPFFDPNGSLMTRLVGVHPRAVIDQIVELRCGTGSSIELLQYTAPHQDQTWAKNSDFAGHHVALYVTDIGQAVAYLEHQPGVQKFLGPFPVTDGPAAGQTINYFKTFFGLYIELISYPNGMAYETTATTRLWNPADVGATPWSTGLPGLLGVDHFGMTVPDIAKARGWLESTLGCSAPLNFGPFFDPVGDLMTQLVDVHPRAVIHHISELRCGANGANIELFQYSSPDQDKRNAPQFRLGGEPLRRLRERHRPCDRGDDGTRRPTVCRTLPGYRRPCRRPVDQLLPAAARALPGAHLLSERNGVRGDRTNSALEPARARRLTRHLPPTCGESPAGQGVLFFRCSRPTTAARWPLPRCSRRRRLCFSQGVGVFEKKTRPRNNESGLRFRQTTFSALPTHLVQVEPLRGRHDGPREPVGRRDASGRSHTHRSRTNDPRRATRSKKRLVQRWS